MCVHACVCMCVCVCACVRVCTNKLHMEALVTKFHFVGKSNISRHMQKSIHATNMIPTVRPGWDKKRVLFTSGRLILDFILSCYLIILLPECGLAGMWWNHQMNCHL